ncbi:hypothetical protein CLV48_12038 [Cecembia rubra]|uniref:Uncharacterized protein n=1 Tax=Cecembia rubra TaxID=1485585 RepID=A0A2P8DL56_9BACT|nr:hypothetical protein CLV48_12038 [Cecembia rubra]
MFYYFHDSFALGLKDLKTTYKYSQIIKSNQGRSNR